MTTQPLLPGMCSWCSDRGYIGIGRNPRVPCPECDPPGYRLAVSGADDWYEEFGYRRPASRPRGRWAA